MIWTRSRYASCLGPTASIATSPKPLMAARMLLKSCATPPASLPTASIARECSSFSARARRSVTSTDSTTIPSGTGRMRSSNQPTEPSG